MRVHWRRVLAGVAGLGGLGFVYARYVEPRRVSLDRYVISVDWPGLPPEGLIILHISDLHWRADGACRPLNWSRSAGC